jgi:lipopolysaccharide export system protein LptC
VTSSNGYHAVLDDALIDIRNATLTTERPVQVEMNEGRLDAQRMEILQSGAVIRFDGVKMTLKGDQFVPPQQGKKQQ